MAKRGEKRERRSMVLEPDAAGIDIGAEEIYVAVPPDRDEESTRRFSSFTGDLHALADWLGRCRIQSVAMESTGVYWIPLFQILEERGLKVYLVNAHYLKSVPGRKSDVSDCQWIQYLHSVGLLRASFRPPEAICLAERLLHVQNVLGRRSPEGFGREPPDHDRKYFACLDPKRQVHRKKPGEILVGRRRHWDISRPFHRFVALRSRVYLVASARPFLFPS